MESTYDIAIIGFGATGVSFLYQLHTHIYEQDVPTVKVALISPAESFSLGLAFGNAETFHQVNTPLHLMGIDPEDPNGFASWIDSNKPVAHADYPSRLTYSEYLRHIYRSILDDKRLEISEYHYEASDIEVQRDTQEITLENGSVVIARQTVLTMGSITAPQFDRCNHYGAILPSEIAQLKTLKTALVAGTGLTSVDCIRSLVRAGCQNIHMFSRNGFAPTVISRSKQYNPQNFTWASLKKILKNRERGDRLTSVFKLLRQEIRGMHNPEMMQAARFLGNL